MRKIFIDGGANKGQSIEAFLAEWPNASEYEIYSFEASAGAEIRQSLENIRKKHKNINIINKALWIEDTFKTFYDDEKTSSSLIKEKPVAYKSAEMVETVNLSNWIKDNFVYSDEIILKLDVEGAEYEILQQMMEEGTILMVNVLLAEIHGSKCGKSIEDSIKLIKNLKSYNHDVYRWEAEDFKYEQYRDLVYSETFLRELYGNWSNRGYDRVVQIRKLSEVTRK